VIVAASDNNKKAILASTDFAIPYRLGRCDVECSSCKALNWREEAALADIGKKSLNFTMCCQENKVTLPVAHPSARKFPSELKGVFDGTNKGEKRL
jgi:hypothetical protein